MESSGYVEYVCNEEGTVVNLYSVFENYLDNKKYKLTRLRSWPYVGWFTFDNWCFQLGFLITGFFLLFFLIKGINFTFLFINHIIWVISKQ